METIIEKLYENRLPAPISGGFEMEHYWVWCGSVIKGEDNRFHMFASRWPKSIPMHPGWMVASEIVRAVSDNPEGPYEFQEVVLGARGADYWDGRMTHNPQIRKYKDTYILFYVGSTHPFEEVGVGDVFTTDDPRCITARSNKRIGIATAKSVFGPWERFDQPILPTRPGKFDSFLTSNPAPCINEDGSVVLVYKARAYKQKPYNQQLHGKMSIGVAFAKNYMGPYEAMTEETLFSIEKYHLEDPFIWKSEKGYHMIAKDMDGNVCGEKHAGIYASSKDGIIWDIRDGVKSYSRRIFWDDGVERVMGSLERPFMLFDKEQPTHMFFATADGPGGFSRATKTWNMVVPLKGV